MRKTFVPGVFLAAWVHSLAFGAGPLPTMDCSNLLRVFYPSVRTEKEALSRFRPNSIVGMEPLSTHVVGRLRTSDDLQFVVRFPSNKDDPVREQFAAEFINRAPGLATPSIRLLDAAATKAVLERIQAINPKFHGRVISEWMGEKAEGFVNAERNMRASLAVYYPIPNGEKSLAEWNVTDLLRDFLVNSVLQNGFVSQPERVASFREVVSKLWGKEGSRQKAALAEDLKKLLPDLKNATEEECLDYLLKHATELHKTDLSRLNELGLARLDPAIRRQLADYWVAYAVLGVDDFHPANWLTHEGRVFGIDLPLPFSAQLRGSDDFLSNGYPHPVGGYQLTLELRDQLLTDMSPALRAYLESMTKAEIAKIASKTPYPLSGQELRFILTRIHKVLSLKADVENRRKRPQEKTPK